jgi:phytoene dehydrogenase-like protein
MAKRVDAIVIGGGHNGLVAAAYLQKAGRQVVVLEREQQVGGILRPTSPAPGFTAPGLIHTVGRLRSSVVKDLKLASYGYRTVSPDVRMHAPLPDGGAVTFWADAAKTAEGIRERSPSDGDA